LVTHWAARPDADRLHCASEAWAHAEVPIEEVLSTSFPWCSSWVTELKKLFAAYVEAKQGQNVLDYDDLLLYWAQMMSDPALAEDVGSRFDDVLVDDSSGPQNLRDHGW